MLVWIAFLGTWPQNSTWGDSIATLDLFVNVEVWIMNKIVCQRSHERIASTLRIQKEKLEKIIWIMGDAIITVVSTGSTFVGTGIWSVWSRLTYKAPLAPIVRTTAPQPLSRIILQAIIQSSRLSTRNFVIKWASVSFTQRISHNG